MTKGDIQYEWTDALILLSVIYAQEKGKADIEAILNAKGVNRVIFTRWDVEKSLSKLISDGYVIEKSGIYSVSNKVKNVCLDGKGLYNVKEGLEGIRKLLGN